jgi:Tfp pilus assembly protein PilX
MIKPIKLHRPCGQFGHSGPKDQGGAISLLVAISLGLLASLASFYSARSVLVDRLASHNQSQAAQARLAAEAALSWARAEMQRQHASSATPPVWGPSPATKPCPAAFSGPRWQCVALLPPAHPGLPDAVV